MAVVIRMKRVGRKNRPSYRISVADPLNPRDGRTLEQLGVYDPRAPRREMQLRIDVERARYWMSVGAKPSETVLSILRREGALAGLPSSKKRSRPGRKQMTATRKRREAAKSVRVQAKTERRAARLAERRAAAKAAPVESAAP